MLQKYLHAERDYKRTRAAEIHIGLEAKPKAARKAKPNPTLTAERPF